MANEIKKDEHRLIIQRREKLAAIRKKGAAFPNNFKPDALNAELLNLYQNKSKEELATLSRRVKIAGRLMTKRIMGKASFATIRDMSGDMQLYIKRDHLPEGTYSEFKSWDQGDIIAASGVMFRTQKGELSVMIEAICLLTKSLRPLPEKFHGLSDREMRYRQRYVDLIMNKPSREKFVIRSKIIDGIRRFLMAKHYLEVETPMMQAIPGGATARPFTTYHHALNMDLFLRIAPELYLKRLVVGGFERVFEINRNFRNEGLSTRHNPEFTMIEFYQAYADYHDFMDLTEEMLRTVIQNVLGMLCVDYQGEKLDFAKPFHRMTVLESILHFNPKLSIDELKTTTRAKKVAENLAIPLKTSDGLGKIQIEIFEKTVEHRLIAPTFITAYPTEVSPLARQSDADPFVTDRFEFFVGGQEIANGFSELNDAEDQAARFQKQALQKELGDIEAMHFDHDYIRALEYGMPPAAGEGIGIDRLVMILTDSASIRDVILFPHMRPE